MKKDNLLKLIELVRDDEFISKNIKYLFPCGKKIDYSLFLSLNDCEIDYIFRLNDSRIRFIQLYLCLNSVSCSDELMKIDLEIDLNIALVLVDIIMSLDNFKDISKLNEIILNISKSSGVKNAEYAGMVIKKMLFIDEVFPENINAVICYVSHADEEFQAKYAADFLMKWNPKIDDNNKIYVYCKLISVAKGVNQAKKVYEYALGHKRDTYGLKIAQGIANANGIVQLNCAMKMIEEFDRWRSDMKVVNSGFVNYIVDVALAKGDIQALRANKLIMDESFKSNLNSCDLLDMVRFITNADYGYQAGYGSLVLEKLVKDNRNRKFTKEIVKIITNAKGIGQVEYASYLAVDKELSLFSNEFILEVVEMIANALGELQAELGYYVIKKTDILSKDNGMLMLDTITKLDDKTCIMIRRNIIDYINKLHEDVCLRIIEDKLEKKDDTEFNLCDLMKMNDLNLIMDIVSSIEDENLSDKSLVATRKLVRCVENIK